LEGKKVPGKDTHWEWRWAGGWVAVRGPCWGPSKAWSWARGWEGRRVGEKAVQKDVQLLERLWAKKLVDRSG
jgi:hypothetical protein